MRLTTIAVVLLTLCPLSALAQSSDCDPPCRAGYTCKDGDCVEKCNPPCPEGQQCTDSGECVPIAGTVQPPVVLGAHGPADPGWAKPAAICGFASGGGILLGAIVAAALYEEPDASIPIGAVTTLFGAISIPVIAVGAASARKGGGVMGLQGLRLVGWIAYGFALVDAIVILGLSIAEVEILPPISISVGLLGAISAGSHAVDALASANEAESMAARKHADSRFRFQPILAAAPARDGGVQVIAGLATTF